MADKPVRTRTKYVPSFEHYCDDFMIAEEDGTEHYPHAGEWIRFRSELPWAAIRIIADEMPTREYYEAMIRVLARQIVDWNWTDDRERPMPRPGDDAIAFERALWDLTSEERGYLYTHCWESSKVPNMTSSPS